MTKNYSIHYKTPVLLIDPSSISAFYIFNPNDWLGTSKAIVSSCAAQYGLLKYSVRKLHELYKISEKQCIPKFNELKAQWEKSPWPTDDCYYLAEVPEVHLFINVFLNSIKAYLDLIVQLISTENIVYKKVHGFHKKGKDPGGKILHTLKNKAKNEECAGLFLKLISDHKQKWIDDVVNARDSLVHPDKGLLQVMFQLEIKSKETELILVSIKKPYMADLDFDQYAEKIFNRLSGFSKSFITLLKAHNKAVAQDR